MSTKAPDLSPQAQDEIASAAEQAQRESDPAKDVRQWLLSTKSATLCTLSCRSELLGYPFGSIVPFAVDGMGRPFIMIADIAAHTANLRADARASLFVSDAKAQGDPQKTWRVGLVGTMQRVLPEGKESAHLNSSQVIESTDYLDLHARYVERVPKAVDYLRQHSFDYWRMNRLSPHVISLALVGFAGWKAIRSYETRYRRRILSRCAER